MTKHDLIFEPPIMNAAGILGFTPDTHAHVDLSKLGAFITNPVSLSPRTPARGQRYIAYPAGFLLHTGFPNPGLASVLKRYAQHWSRSTLPVIVHLVARGAGEFARMARRLEGVDGVSGIEIGFDSDTTSELLAECVQAASGELTVIARLPFERCLELAEAAARAGVAAVSMAPPRGALRAGNGTLMQGRLYGPAIMPMALRLAQEVKSLGIPIIGAGGIYTRADIDAMLAAGAVAVQLDGALWKGAEPVTAN